MARRPEEGPTESLSVISGWTREKVEHELAKQQGLYCPSAGLPDENAIEKAFGFSRDLIHTDKTRKYLGKSRPKPTSEDSSSDSMGQHKEYGADV